MKCLAMNMKAVIYTVNIYRVSISVQNFKPLYILIAVVVRERERERET